MNELARKKMNRIGQQVGVLVVNRDGKPAVITDLGRVTWLDRSVLGPVEEEDKP